MPRRRLRAQVLQLYCRSGGLVARAEMGGKGVSMFVRFWRVGWKAK